MTHFDGEKIPSFNTQITDQWAKLANLWVRNMNHGRKNLLWGESKWIQSVNECTKLLSSHVHCALSLLHHSKKEDKLKSVMHNSLADMSRKPLLWNLHSVWPMGHWHNHSHVDYAGMVNLSWSIFHYHEDISTSDLVTLFRRCMWVLIPLSLHLSTVNIIKVQTNNARLWVRRFSLPCSFCLAIVFCDWMLSIIRFWSESSYFVMFLLQFHSFLWFRGSISKWNSFITDQKGLDIII